jgi:hypothetical protein
MHSIRFATVTASNVIAAFSNLSLSLVHEGIGLSFISSFIVCSIYHLPCYIVGREVPRAGARAPQESTRNYACQRPKDELSTRLQVLVPL